MKCYREDTYVFLQGVKDEGFELVQWVVDALTSPLLYDGFLYLQRITSKGIRTQARQL